MVEYVRKLRDQPSERTNDRGFIPVCLMGVRDFRSDFESELRSLHVTEAELERHIGATARNEDANRILALHNVLSEPYSCSEWARYIEGWNPQEHKAMLDRRWERSMMVKQSAIQGLSIVVAALAIAVGGYCTMEAARISSEQPIIVNISPQSSQP